MLLIRPSFRVERSVAATVVLNREEFLKHGVGQIHLKPDKKGGSTTGGTMRAVGNEWVMQRP
jgi:hypothetical protein